MATATEQRTFATEILVSVATGRLLAPIGAVNEASEFLLGHEIWTHEYADKQVQESLVDAVCLQHPDLRDFDVSGCNRDNWREYVATIHRQFGSIKTVTRGSRMRAETPAQSARRMMTQAKVVKLDVSQGSTN